VITIINSLAFAAALAVFVILLLYTLRRLLFTLTLLVPQLSIPDPASLPSVLLTIPARDESASLPSLFSALDALDYPRDLLQIVLIDDGSTDSTAELMASAAASRPNWSVLNLSTNVGKAQALNLALAGHTFGDIVYIFDVDHHPNPDCLRLAVAVFADPRVAGVSGRTIAANALASPPAFYAAVESVVHQLITVRGKDVLRLGPALLGSNNGYRRSALAEVGGFRSGALLEDSDLTLSLHRAGFIVRFIPMAISAHHVPVTLGGYIRQHLRWGRGFNEVARAHLGSLIADNRLSLPVRVELAVFSLGYLDRLALLAAIALAAVGIARPLMTWSIGVSLAVPFLQIIAALAFDRAPLAVWLRLPWVPLLSVCDAFVAVWAAASTVLNLPRVWHKTERA